MNKLAPYLKRFFHGVPTMFLARKSGLFVPFKANENLLKHGCDGVLSLLKNHKMLFALVAKTHCFLKIVLEKNSIPITKNDAESAVKAINESVDTELVSQKNSMGRVYDVTKNIVKKEMQMSGLLLVGLWHQQEETLKNLIRQEKFFLFSSKIENKIKNKENVFCMELFLDMAEKFNISKNGYLFKTIKECNAFANDAKHGGTKNLNKFYDNKTNKCNKKCVEIAILTNSPDKIFLWRNILIKYVKALESFWVSVFKNLEKPSSEDGAIKFFKYHDDEPRMNILTCINKTEEVMQKRIIKFWKDIERKHGVKHDEGNFKCSCV